EAGADAAILPAEGGGNGLHALAALVAGRGVCILLCAPLLIGITGRAVPCCWRTGGRGLRVLQLARESGLKGFIPAAPGGQALTLGFRGAPEIGVLLQGQRVNAQRALVPAEKVQAGEASHTR